MPALLASVALQTDLSERGLVRGQVGNLVEQFDEGRAYAVAPRPLNQLLPQRTAPLAA